MKSEKIRKRKLLIFAVLFAILALNVSVGCAFAATYTVCPIGCNYTSIQAAIGAAYSGDTIEVYSGTYYEDVNVTKQLILRGVDTGSGKPVVAAGGNGSAITLSANGIVLDGFTVTNSGHSSNDAGIKVTSNYNNITGNNASSNNNYGISLYYSNNNRISGNNASNNRWAGIHLSKSRNNTITGNTASNNRDGFHLSSTSYYNTITGNTASNNRWYGIYLDGRYLQDFCSNNNITGNTASYNGWGIVLGSSRSNTITRNNASNNDYCGIDLRLSRNNNITGNTASYNVWGILLGSSRNNTITRNNANNNHGVGICIGSSSNNTITGNTASYNNNSGIYIDQSSNNTITGNTASYNKWSGIKLWRSRNNTITGNTASNNDWYGIYLSYGIRLRDSSDNKIYLNNFINSDNVGSENSTNVWNLPKKIDYVYNGNACENYLGNYWSDYTGSDADTDGICDTSYSIDSDKDNYPLMTRFENYII